jgi:hypothetical protein
MDAVIHDIVRVFRRVGWPAALGLSVGAALGSIALAALIVVRWPPDQFKSAQPLPFMAQRHPLVRGLGLLGKNIAGYVVILLGIVMALPGVPGQGFLMILIGLTLINFPGKRRLERRLIGTRTVLHAINRIRARFRRSPLEVD